MESKQLAACGLIMMLCGTACLFQKGITPAFAADDYAHLNKNIHLQNWRKALSVFLHLDGREYRPLVRFSLWANFNMTGTSAFSFHLTNLLLHLGCSACIYCIGLLLFRSATHAWLGSFIFAIHPIHATNVNFVMGRTDLLCTFFYLAAVIFFTHYLCNQKGKIYYWFSLAFFLLALFSKEMAVTLPLILVVLSLWFGSSERWGRAIGSSLLATLPFWIVLLPYLAVRIFFWSQHPEQVAVYTNYHWTNIVKIFTQSAFGLIYPVDLYEARRFYENQPAIFRTICGGVAAILIGMLLYLRRRKRKLFLKDKLLGFGLFWFFITLLPVIGGAALRWLLYLPSVSLSFFFIAIYRSLAQHKRKYAIVGLGIWAALSANELYKQALIWEKQSQFTKGFFGNAERLGLHKLETFYFVNVPYGYKSSFLFTHHSLQDAFSLNFGGSPQIKILSYLNFSDKTKINVAQENGKMHFQIEPDVYNFFIFSPDQRVLRGPGTIGNCDGHEIFVDRLTPAKMAASYEVRMPSQRHAPLYLFDGKDMHLVNVRHE